MIARAAVVNWASWDELAAEYGGDTHGMTRAALEAAVHARCGCGLCGQCFRRMADAPVTAPSEARAWIRALKGSR